MRKEQPSIAALALGHRLGVEQRTICRFDFRNTEIDVESVGELRWDALALRGHAVAIQLVQFLNCLNAACDHVAARQQAATAQQLVDRLQELG